MKDMFTETPSDSLAIMLLVDDGEADVAITRIMLVERPKLQCHLLVATTAEDAIAILQKQVKENEPVDIVLLDVNMPGMDGFELLEFIKTDPALKDTSVIMSTGSLYDRDREKSYALGASGYVVKPTDWNSLKPVLEKLPLLKIEEKKAGPALLKVQK